MTNIELVRQIGQRRDEIFSQVKNMFTGIAIEAHLLGSISTDKYDDLSDIDIWFTFDDIDMNDILFNRLDYYSKIGEIVNFCEPPQNAPFGGVHSSVMYKLEGGGYVVVDYYLCPLSTSHLTVDSKSLFGPTLSVEDMRPNLSRGVIPETYRIDFFIIIATSAFKKLYRNKENPLDQLIKEYDLLYSKYEIPLPSCVNKNQDITLFIEIIDNVINISNEKQKMALQLIRNMI